MTVAWKSSSLEPDLSAAADANIVQRWWWVSELKKEHYVRNVVE